MSAGRRASSAAIPKHRGPRDVVSDGRDRAAAGHRRGPGRRRRETARTRFFAWLGVGRRARLERELFEAHLRELRLATATLRAEVSVLRHELDLATALAAERTAETRRMSLLLPLVRDSFAAAADRRMRIYLGHAPDVQALEVSPNAVVDLRKRTDVTELEPRGAGDTEILLPLEAPAAAPSASTSAVPQGAHRRTA